MNNEFNLHLAIGKGDVHKINFTEINELIEYVYDIYGYDFDCIWLLAFIGCRDEVIVSEDINIIGGLIEDNTTWIKDNNIYLYQYQSYEDAYKVALMIRETNPKCYNSK